MSEHKGHTASSFLAPGWYAYCICGWTTGPLAYDREEVNRRLQEHLITNNESMTDEHDCDCRVCEEVRIEVERLRKELEWVAAYLDAEFSQDYRTERIIASVDALLSRKEPHDH